MCKFNQPPTSSISEFKISSDNLHLIMEEDFVEIQPVSPNMTMSDPNLPTIAPSRPQFMMLREGMPLGSTVSGNLHLAEPYLNLEEALEQSSLNDNTRGRARSRRSSIESVTYHSVYHKRRGAGLFSSASTIGVIYNCRSKLLIPPRARSHSANPTWSSGRRRSTTLVKIKTRDLTSSLPSISIPPFNSQASGVGPSHTVQDNQIGNTHSHVGQNNRDQMRLILSNTDPELLSNAAITCRRGGLQQLKDLLGVDVLVFGDEAVIGNEELTARDHDYQIELQRASYHDLHANESDEEVL